MRIRVMAGMAALFMVASFIACGGDDGSPTGINPNTHVRTLADEQWAAGVHHVAWDQKDESGSLVAAGTYRAVLRTEEDRVSTTFVINRSTGYKGYAAADPDTADPVDPVPHALYVGTDLDRYAPGDSVTISCSRPQAGQVLVWIESATN